MSDFDDDLGDNFFTSGDETPQTDRPGGLIVGPIARQIFAKNGECLYDELPLIERGNILSRRPPVLFVEADEPEVGS